MDLLPTALELAGRPLPADREYDGKSMVPLLLRDEPSAHEVLFFYGGAAPPSTSRPSPSRATCPLDLAAPTCPLDPALHPPARTQAPPGARCRRPRATARSKRTGRPAPAWAAASRAPARRLAAPRSATRTCLSSSTWRWDGRRRARAPQLFLGLRTCEPFDLALISPGAGRPVRGVRAHGQQHAAERPDAQAGRAHAAGGLRRAGASGRAAAVAARAQRPRRGPGQVRCVLRPREGVRLRRQAEFLNERGGLPRLGRLDLNGNPASAQARASVLAIRATLYGY